MQHLRHMPLALYIVALVASYSYALGVLTFVCVDPDQDCSGWSPFRSVISEHPGTQFYLVVNNDFCPGSAGSPPKPSYQECAPGLRHPNSAILGHIDTVSSSSRILEQIDTYAGWNSSFRPTGILFDTTSVSSVTKYKPYISHAREKGFDFIAMDPGRPPNPDYYSLVDLVVTYEDLYNPFTITELEISSSTPASKQVVMLYNAPSIGSYHTILSQLISARVEAVYITDEINNGDPTSQWRKFVDQVATSGGISVIESSTSSSRPPYSTSSSTRVHEPLLPTITQAPSTPKGELSSTPVGAIVGGTLGGVIVVLVFSLFFIWTRRMRRPPPPHDASVDPFRFLQHQGLVRPKDKNSSSSRQVSSNRAGGLSQPSNNTLVPNEPLLKKRWWEFIEFLPRSAMPSVSRNWENPPPYSAPSTEFV